MSVSGKSTAPTGLNAMAELLLAMLAQTSLALRKSTTGVERHGNSGPHAVLVDAAALTSKAKKHSTEELFPHLTKHSHSKTGLEFHIILNFHSLILTVYLIQEILVLPKR